MNGDTWDNDGGFIPPVEETIMAEDTHVRYFDMVQQDMSYTLEPTCELKWLNGVLMQKFIERGPNVGIRHVWHPVPYENTETH